MLGAFADGVDAGAVVSQPSSTMMPRLISRPPLSASAVSGRMPAAITTSAQEGAAILQHDALGAAAALDGGGLRLQHDLDALRLDRVASSAAARASSWRSISRGMRWRASPAAARASPYAASMPEQPATNHDGARARPRALQAADIVEIAEGQ